MSNKNPFEIRTEVLAMAINYMDKQHAFNLEKAQKANEALGSSQVPVMYTTEELMEKAKELYSFVSKKD